MDPSTQANAGGFIVFRLYGPSTAVSCTASNLVFTSAQIPVDGVQPLQLRSAHSGVARVLPLGRHLHERLIETNVATGSCGDSNETVVVRDSTTSTSAQPWLPNDSATVTSTGGNALNGKLTIQLFTGDNCGATSGAGCRPSLQLHPHDEASGTAHRRQHHVLCECNRDDCVSWKSVFTSSDPNATNPAVKCEVTTLTITN